MKKWATGGKSSKISISGSNLAVSLMHLQYIRNNSNLISINTDAYSKILLSDSS